MLEIPANWLNYFPCPIMPLTLSQCERKRMVGEKWDGAINGNRCFGLQGIIERKN